MSDTFITADEHYGHNFIREVCNRPFASNEEMTEAIIERHNKKVPNKKSYITIHAGDMFWRTVSEAEACVILSRLHGRHAFLFGNHDELMENRKGSLLYDMFEWVRGENKENTSYSTRFNKHLLVISHFAQRVWQKSHQGSWHVYGHSHGELPELGYSFDIGVDGHDFYPWSTEEIEAKMATKTSSHVIPADKIWDQRPEGIIYTPTAMPLDHLPEGSH